MEMIQGGWGAQLWCLLSHTLMWGVKTNFTLNVCSEVTGPKNLDPNYRERERHMFSSLKCPCSKKKGWHCDVYSTSLTLLEKDLVREHPSPWLRCLHSAMKINLVPGKDVWLLRAKAGHGHWLTWCKTGNGTPALFVSRHSQLWRKPIFLACLQGKKSKSLKVPSSRVFFPLK